jgi:hypothetical protein
LKSREKLERPLKTREKLEDPGEHTFNFVGNIDVPAFLSFQPKAAPAFLTFQPKAAPASLTFQPKAAPAFPPEKSIPPHCRSLIA